MTEEEALTGLYKVSLIMLVLVIAGVDVFEAYESQCVNDYPSDLQSFLEDQKLISFERSGWVGLSR